MPQTYEKLLTHDDALVEAITDAIRGTFDPSNIAELRVEFCPDGSVKLIGKVTDAEVKNVAGRTAATQTVRGERLLKPRAVDNVLQIVGRKSN